MTFTEEGGQALATKPEIDSMLDLLELNKYSFSIALKARKRFLSGN